jgi:hypothetical protein
MSGGTFNQVLQRYEVFMSVKTEFVVFWVVALSSVVAGYGVCKNKSSPPSLRKSDLPLLNLTIPDSVPVKAPPHCFCETNPESTLFSFQGQPTIPTPHCSLSNTLPCPSLTTRWPCIWLLSECFSLPMRTVHSTQLFLTVVAHAVNHLTASLTTIQVNSLPIGKDWASHQCFNTCGT